MAWDVADFRRQYDKLARLYDAGLWLYRLAGFRIAAYRRSAVDALKLERGQTVIDLGCGTGLNFPLLREAVGESGRIIGVDISGGMLERARRRAQRNGWHNIELVEDDMREYHFEPSAAGVIATLALGTVPDYERIVENMVTQLPCDARIANVELKWPERWPHWLASLAAWLNRPAGVTPDILDRLPADSLRAQLVDVDYREVYLGAGYICSGTIPARSVS